MATAAPAGLPCHRARGLDRASYFGPVGLPEKQSGPSQAVPCWASLESLGLVGIPPGISGLSEPLQPPAGSSVPLWAALAPTGFAKHANPQQQWFHTCRLTNVLCNSQYAFLEVDSIKVVVCPWLCCSYYWGALDTEIQEVIRLLELSVFSPSYWVSNTNPYFYDIFGGTVCRVVFVVPQRPCCGTRQPSNTQYCLRWYWCSDVSVGARLRYTFVWVTQHVSVETTTTLTNDSMQPNT